MYTFWYTTDVQVKYATASGSFAQILWSIKRLPLMKKQSMHICIKRLTFNATICLMLFTVQCCHSIYTANQCGWEMQMLVKVPNASALTNK